MRISHAALEAKNQEVIPAASILATRPADANRWALLLATQDYDDKSLSPLSCAVPDAKLLGDVLVRHTRCRRNMPCCWPTRAWSAWNRPYPSI